MVPFLDTVLAASPVLLTLILLLVFKVSSMRTAIIAYLLAIFITLVPLQFHISLSMVGHASIEGLLISIIVIYVLVFGLLLYNVLKHGRAIQTISKVLMQNTNNPAEQALLISAALGPFLESTSGFGIGIVIAAPLYLAIGFDAKKAAILSLLTQSAVPWGALAVGTVINAELSHVSLQSLGITSSLIAIPLYFLYTNAVVFIIGGWREIRKNLGSILVVWGFLSVSTWFSNAFISTQLAGVLAGFITTIGLLVYWRLFSDFKSKSFVEETAAANDESKIISFRRAILPYGILVTYLLFSNLIPWFSLYLQSIAVWRLPSYGYQLELVYNPGFALFVASVFAMYIYRLNWSQIHFCLVSTLKQVYPAAISTSGFVAMSTVMQQASMINLISANVAIMLGSSFLFISPLIGGLGGFITGSNSAANAMFAPFQSAMAHKLHSSDLLYATSQNVSASSLTMASPSRISLAAAITEQSGSEGDLTGKILILSLVALFIIVICCVILKWFLH